jgi:branched-chain amino acid transport system ATP-binding protein
MPMRDPILSISGLNAHYGDFHALYDVDMKVEQGEILAIIGANGAGKTTLMRSISGLMQNGLGQVAYQGNDISSMRADQVAGTGIALVPEGRQLFQSLSVEENLIIGGQIGRKGPWHLDAVFKLFPILKERRAVPATSLSGGQQQMVAIGRALMANPDLILFDEISLGLAPIIIKDIYDALPGIIGEGMSAMIVEQDISKALSVSQRVYCLQEGRVSLTGVSNAISREEISRAYFGIE